MGLLLRMAWRNILRNRRRTILTASMIALGLGSLILTDAYIVDMTRNMVGTATDNFFGQAQVHVKGFRVEDKVEQTVRDLPRVEALLREDPSVSAFSERVSTASMVSSASDAESVILYGIDPAAERKISRLAAAVRAGNPLADADGNGVLLGDRLAKTLQVGVGDRVVVTCTQAVSGELSQEMFRVRGIFSFDTPEMDRGMAFVGLTQAQKMMSLGGMVHEIAIRFKTGTGSEASHLGLYQNLSQGGNEALDWSRLLPDLKSAIDLTGFSSAILAALLAALAALAILNTLFMSLYERMFEFGVLRALGTRPSQLALLVLLEAGCMGGLSVVLGMALGLAFTGILSLVGINYSGIEFAGVTLQSIHPQIRLLQYTAFPLGVWLFTVLIALYPALHAARIEPAKAMHRSLG